MFQSTVVVGQVFADESGISYEMPVLLTASGPVMLILDYLLSKWDEKSPNWMLKVTLSIRLFLQYLSVQPTQYPDRNIFQSFRHRLQTGTITAPSGEDSSGLWWEASGPRKTRRILRHLTDLFDWWASENPGKTSPIVVPSGAHELRLSQAAYEYRRNKAFLGHTWSTLEEASRKPNGTGLRSPGWHSLPKTERPVPPSFPEDRVLDLLLKGFKVGRRYNYRDMLITLLLNGAGFRKSEPFHLFLSDVTEDPLHKGQALVLIHHPAWGDAPPDPQWRDASGRPRQGNRATYLKERYGLVPRDWGLTKAAAGWKGGMHESQYGGYYKQAYWFVPELGKLFWDFWQLYLDQVMRIDVARRCHHPYAFMNVLREPIGDPCQLHNFDKAYAAAVRRIGLIPDERLGTHVHGHRHGYAQRLRKAHISKEFIRRFMHHADIESQEVYTGPSHDECLLAIQQGLGRMEERTARLASDVSRLLLPCDERRRLFNGNQYA